MAIPKQLYKKNNEWHMDKQKIESILDHFKLEGKVRIHTLNLSLELAGFLILSDDELGDISKKEVNDEKQKVNIDVSIFGR